MPVSRRFPAENEDLKTIDGWRGVLTTLEGFYEAELTVDELELEGPNTELNDTLKAVLELVLGAVVQCETKEKFVKDILTMEDAVQTDLMRIIEKVMAKGAAILSERVQVDVVKSGENESPGLGSPLYLSRNAALERLKRENGVLKEENIHLARELEKMTTKYCEVDTENTKLVEMMKQLKEQIETDVLRKERAMHSQYDERIQSLQVDLNLAKADLKDKGGLAAQVPQLRDELDLLRPLAEKMKKADSTVAKYKAKIDELSGAKDRLRVTERANAELLEKNLVLENNLAKGASCQRKLNEVKAANTTAEFRICELETLLSRERKEHGITQAELSSIQEALQESKVLNTQLQEFIGHQVTVDEIKNDNDNSSSTRSMSDGISEFNPKLMQKITRLEFENVELKKQIGSETGARIETLLDEVDELDRLKKLFEKKYFDTQRDLQSTQSDFKHAKEQFKSTVAELQARNQELNNWKLCIEEDIATHVLERQSLVAQRNRLSTELSASSERENCLARAVSCRDRELFSMKEASELIVRKNEQLAEQCALLSITKQGIETNLARQIECVAMQEEDATARRIQLQEDKTRELNHVYVQYEEEDARKTALLDAKSTEIEQLMTRMQEHQVDSEAKQRRLEIDYMSTIKKFERYQEQYSISNADWNTKEDELNNRVTELERICNQCKQHERTLKSTIKSQLQSNAQLVEKNKAMKTNTIESRETITTLEKVITRLESKVTVLEKERSRFTFQEEKKRDAEDGISSYSSQLCTQVSVVVAELENVLKENTELYAKQAGCKCGRELLFQGGISDSSQKAMTYYLNRIQQLESGKYQAEHKRRELLLVNAKLIQEQKQLQVKNVNLSCEVRALEESVNHWRLRDERRRKKERQPRLLLESNISFSYTAAKVPSENLPSNSTSNDLPSQEHPSHNTPSMLSVSKTAARDESILTKPHSTQKFATSHPTRKRKLKANDTMSESVQPKRTQPDPSGDNFTDASAFFSKLSDEQAQSNEPRSKRRFSHFITHKLSAVPHKTIPQNDKPDNKQQ